MKRILVPVDYSDHAVRVVDFASKLAAPTGASLDIVYVWECQPHVPARIKVKTPTGDVRPLEDLIADEAKSDMEAFMKRVTLPAGVTAETHIHSGPAAHVILETLGRGEHDAVVMGTHGRTGLNRFILGSVAEKVLRGSPVPVMTVPMPPT